MLQHYKDNIITAERLCNNTGWPKSRYTVIKLLLKFAVVLLLIVIKLFFICFEVTCSALYVTC